MTTLFLLAHQDDEIGVLSIIREEAKQDAARCVHLTNGAWAGVSSETRNAESRKVLASVGVPADHVTPIGTNLAIPDGRLVEHLESVFTALCAYAGAARATAPVTRIITHAWEGGHQDHDASYLLGVALARNLGILSESRQFPLYRQAARAGSIAFAAPLAANGPVEALPISRADRVRNLMALSSYRSQVRVIARLFPLIARDYSVNGRQNLQPLSIERASQQPNSRPMLYEHWKLYDYDQFQSHAAPFIARHLASNGQVSTNHRSAS